jgi:hypothetical protein
MTLLRTLTLAVAIIAPTAAGAEPIRASVVLVRDTTTLGQNKPPRRPDDVTFRGSASGRTKNDAVGDRLSRGICIGCNAR